ncbi:MAG TPA: beta/gamma crystallin-related protein [Burkholderiaceae bacterium]|nr:beta/gamma crystallin-related protein [Burkholderiaceae bacterium]
MNKTFHIAIALTGLAIAAQATAQVTFYESSDFRGRTFTTAQPVRNFSEFGFNDRASSAVVSGNRSDRWEVCEDGQFRGRCVTLRPGQYPSLSAMGLNDRVSSARIVDRNARVDPDRYAPVPPPAQTSQVVFYENERFQGRTYTTERQVRNFRRTEFNDRASSAVVRGNPWDRWEVCEDGNFRGRCVVLRPGQYPSLSAMGLNDRVSSTRVVARGAQVDDDRYAPLPMVSRDYGRRRNERLYEAEITSVRAVVEESGERCWVEQEQVTRESGGANVPGALIGAVIGGILGHQVGGGTGKNVATGVGIVGGALLGGNVGRSDGDQQQAATRNVQRCSSAPGQGRPAYWDVTYDFRGEEHRVQLTTPPGRTISVNNRGEPRG